MSSILRWGAMFFLGATMGLGSLATGCEGEIEAPTVGARPPPPFEPAPAQLRRLTQPQYRNAVTDLFGEIVLPARLEPDERVDGLYQIGAHLTTISARGTELYEAAAYQVASQAVDAEHRDRWVGCAPAGVVDRACAEQSLRTLGRRVWRRPLSEVELAQLVEIGANAARQLGDFYAGLEFSVATLLQSPHFLFRREVGAEIDGQRRHTGWETAERLSFFLWNTIPDDALLDAAARGELGDHPRYAEHVDRLLADPRAKQGVRAFFTEMLELDELDELRKDPTIFEHYTPELGGSAREETLRLIEYLVFEQDADYRDLMTTRTTFIDRRLASLYGVPAPSRDGFGRYDFPEGSERVGLLGHISVLALQAHASVSSPTLRGIFVRRNLLCGAIPPPPANVDTSIPEPLPGSVTLRDRVARHLEDPSCAGCHRLMDPLGLGLENFDAIGRWRDTESGEPIDTSGDINGVAFSTPSELAHTLAVTPDLTQCLMRTAYRYATGHKEVPGEAATLRDLSARFEQSGYRVLPLLRSVALSDGFRRVGAPVITVESSPSGEVSP